MTESSTLTVLNCPRIKETAPKAGTAGFSRLNNNLKLITANLCSRDLAALSRTSKKLNGIATNAAKQRIVQLIQNKEIKGIPESIEDITKNQLTAIIFLKDNHIQNINSRHLAFPLLHQCFLGNEMELTRALIATRADADVMDPNRNTLLHMAANLGCKAIVNDLLDVKAYVHTVDSDGRTVVHYGSSSIVDLFDRFSVNLSDLPGNKADIIKALIKAEANPNAKDDYGQTPLHYAADDGNTESVKALIKSRAKVDEKDNYGNTPLNFATRNRQKEIIYILKKASYRPCTIL